MLAMLKTFLQMTALVMKMWTTIQLSKVLHFTILSILLACQFDPSVVVRARYMMDVLIDCGRGQNGLEDSKFHQLTLKVFPPHLWWKVNHGVQCHVCYYPKLLLCSEWGTSSYRFFIFNMPCLICYMLNYYSVQKDAMIHKR